jgi:dienelactone hydrolase
VGRTTIAVVDSSRNDPNSTRGDGKREFMALVWYPADPQNGARRADWVPPSWDPYVTEDLAGMIRARSPEPIDDAGVLKIIKSISAHSFEDAPPAKAATPFPFLVFAPGASMLPTMYTSLLEDIASHGYVVAGLVPAGFVSGVVFPDGHVVHGVPKTARNWALWPEDMRFIIDQAALWNADPHSLLYKSLDMKRVGVFGHSAGGNAASVVGTMDAAVKCAINLDGVVNRQETTEKSFLLFTGEDSSYIRSHANDPEVLATLKSRDAFLHASKNALAIKLVGAQHMSFSDMAVVPEFHLDKDGQDELASVRAVVLAFFDENLRGRHSDLIHKGLPQYPLVKIVTQG